APERRCTKQQVYYYRPRCTDQHPALPADPVRKQPVNDLTAAVGDEVPEQDPAHVLVREMELVLDRLVRVGKIIATKIVTGVHQPDDRPVEAASRTITGGQRRRGIQAGRLAKNSPH